MTSDNSEPVRVATKIADIRNELEELHERLDDEKQRGGIKTAAATLKKVEKRDREKHGATPEDKLSALIESTDECLTCGEPIDEGGWCGLGCLQDYEGDSDG